jgi:hypothetical protein
VGRTYQIENKLDQQGRQATVNNRSSQSEKHVIGRKQKIGDHRTALVHATTRKRAQSAQKNECAITAPNSSYLLLVELELRLLLEQVLLPLRVPLLQLPRLQRI